jgi:uncharacterized protein YoxC
VNEPQDWITLSVFVAVGVGALLVGVGVLIAGIALARTLGRVNVTLDVVDRQIDGLSGPVGKSLDHIGGIADTADATLGRLGGVVDALEGTLTPAIDNLGAVLVGITAGLRRIVTGRTSSDGL